MVVEVFERRLDIEVYSNSPNKQDKKRDSEDSSSPNEKVEYKSKEMTDAKKEYFEHLEDDSLNIDTCSRLNREW
ncbi:MAG: hypothetical protein WC867_04045 [Candidatus Pacearchaeota archaeon]|jgi:hypothetical protein